MNVEELQCRGSEIKNKNYSNIQKQLKFSANWKKVMEAIYQLQYKSILTFLL
jgi:hypothetical protein